MKALIRWTILICMSVLLVSYSVVAQDSKPTNVTLMLDWFPNADHVPLYAAQQKGIFKQHGLEVELLAPADPNDPLKLVAAGKYPFAVNYQPSVTIARSQGLPVKAIGVLVEHPLNTISFLKESGIKTPSDLKGKTIGYAVGPLDVVLFETIARNAGLQKEDYELINIGFNITPSLLSGKIDAVIGAYWNYEINELALEGKEAGYFPLEKHGVPDFYELVFISNDTFLKEHPETAKRLMMAMRQAIQFTKDHPDDLVATTALGIAKAPDLGAANHLNRFLTGILNPENDLFERAFRALGASEAEYTSASASPTTQAFGDFLVRVGLSGEFEEILTLLYVTEGTYLDWGSRLLSAGQLPEHPIYREWIELHGPAVLGELVGWMDDHLDRADLSQRRSRMETLFLTALRYEYRFWEAAYHGEDWV